MTTKVAASPAPFDIGDPLPEGLTLLEASAGTGKTFAIAALVARFVAAGTPLDNLLIITFTRAATGELRDRVRQRLLGSLAAVDRHLVGGVVGDDEVDRFLTSGTPDEVARHRHRLAGALADFDRATIVTTHAFCEDVLRGLGIVGDVDRNVTFLEDPGDLVAEVVDDLYLRKFFRRGSPPFTRDEALRIAQAAVGALGVQLQPTEAEDDSDADLRYRFARAARVEVARRKKQANTLGYDDILTSLAESLDPPDTPRALAAARRLQDRYKVVLVDEFQDTDPTQWKILRSGFAPSLGGSTVVLVGDPKQAIYSFRGADVWTYLEAATCADDRKTLGINWRSDQGLLDGIAALLDGAALGHRRIRFRAARAAATNQEPRLVGAPVSTPVRIRVVLRSDPRLDLLKRVPTVASVRDVIASDLAADIVTLLGSGAELIDRGLRAPHEDHDGDEGHSNSAGTGEARRCLEPGDVAVLVGTNREAGLVRTCLDAAAVPAVINGGGNVFATPVAIQWLQLLEALERPSFTNRARAAALTVFIGWDAAALAAATEADVDGLQATLHTWAAVLEHQGVAALVELITVETQLPSRVLAFPRGERVLTDLRHVGELLHSEAASGQWGVPALAAWIRRRIGEGERTDAAEERSRRLESDAAAVQVLTIHRSKGLEFPVVYLPDLADHGNQFRSLPTYHDPHSGHRALDVGGLRSPDYDEHRRRFEDEELGEDLRQAYVALTRARQQVVLWWGPFRWQGSSPLGNFLCAPRDVDGVLGPVRDIPADEGIVTLLTAVAARAPGCVAVEIADHHDVAASRVRRLPVARRDLAVRVFDRSLDTEWRRTSYTAITAGHDPRSSEPAVGSEPENQPLTDEVSADSSLQEGVDSSLQEGASDGVGERGDRALEATLRAVPSPMAALPRGAGFGITVHGVLERVSFDVDDLALDLSTACRAVARFAPADLDQPTLVTALMQVIESPLGPLVDGLALRNVTVADRLDEVGFELPLAGGDVPCGEVDIGAVSDLLRRWLPDDDPLAPYPDRLADPAFGGKLRGYLTGSIDLLLRVPRSPGRLAVSSPATERFVVVDYKTNWLGPPDEPLTSWSYRPAMLSEAMIKAHYPLQALLYSVAAHRFLRWRLPGYTPERNLGGVVYLFLRGMAGVTTPLVAGHPCGVFSWRPAAGLVLELSDLLDRGIVT